VVPGTTLTLEQLARVTARIDAGMPRDRALAEAAIPLTAWEAGQELWLSRMAYSAARQNLDLCRRYASMLLAERHEAERALDAARRTLDGTMPVFAPARLSPIALPNARDHAPLPRQQPSSEPNPSPWAAASSYRATPGAYAAPAAVESPPAMVMAPRSAASPPRSGRDAPLSGAPFVRPSSSARPPAFWHRIAHGPRAAADPRALAATSAMFQPTPMPASPPPGLRLTVEQLAWLHARLELPPHTVPAARQQLGLNEAEQAQEDARYGELFGRDRSLFAQYQQLLSRYRRMLR
jgi:hypothetical protein